MVNTTFIYTFSSEEFNELIRGLYRSYKGEGEGRGGEEVLGPGGGIGHVDVHRHEEEIMIIDDQWELKRGHLYVVRFFNGGVDSSRSEGAALHWCNIAEWWGQWVIPI